jgi:hypothetical protein
MLVNKPGDLIDRFFSLVWTNKTLKILIPESYNPITTSSEDTQPHFYNSKTRDTQPHFDKFQDMRGATPL